MPISAAARIQVYLCVCVLCVFVMCCVLCGCDVSCIFNVCTHPQEFKTKTIKGTYEPVWDEEFEFEIDEAQNLNDSLIIKVYDWDSTTKDDFIGQVG